MIDFSGSIVKPTFDKVALMNAMDKGEMNRDQILELHADVVESFKEVVVQAMPVATMRKAWVHRWLTTCIVFFIITAISSMLLYSEHQFYAVCTIVFTFIFTFLVSGEDVKSDMILDALKGVSTDLEELGKHCEKHLVDTYKMRIITPEEFNRWN